MHNEATCREKLVRKLQKETTEKQNDRERKREIENIFRWKQRFLSYHLSSVKARILPIPG